MKSLLILIFITALTGSSSTFERSVPFQDTIADWYAIQPQNDKYHAINPDHNFDISFDRYDIEIDTEGQNWRLSSREQPNNISVSANKLTYHYGAFDTWYVNSASGLQQGFTLYEPSNVKFEVGGTLSTRLDNDILVIENEAGTAILTYCGLIAWDSRNVDVPVKMTLTDQELQFIADDSDAVYPITIDPWVQKAKIVPADLSGGEHFGTSIVIDGDTAFIGAPLSSAVYVYKHVGDSWIQEDKLVVEVGDSYGFGFSIAVDGNTLLIGAPFTQNYRGTAFVFMHNGTEWIQRARLVAADKSAVDRFGYAVALEGDTALISAPYTDDNGVASGSTYVFERSGTVWQQTAKLIPADNAVDDHFGFSISVEGNRVLIGALTDYGTVYEYRRNAASEWVEYTTLVPEDTVYNNRFGNHVKLVGNMAIVGAYEDDEGELLAGSVYIFEYSNGLWTQQAKLIPAGIRTFSYFGTSFDFSDDILLVGAPGDRGIDDDYGSVYVYQNIGDTWVESAKIFAADGAYREEFGAEVAFDGSTAFIAAPADDVQGTRSGSVYFYTLETVPLVASASCIDENLVIAISQGDWPFEISASAGVHLPRTVVQTGVYIIDGPEKWDDVAVTEGTGDHETIQLGQFKCRTGERPVLYSPTHQSQMTNPFPMFSWSPLQDANNYRIFLFDDPDPGTRLVDIRENSGGVTQMTLSQPLTPGRYFWRVRARQNRIWTLWSYRWTLFIISITPEPTNPAISNPPITTPLPNDRQPVAVTPVPTLPAPPNSR